MKLANLSGKTIAIMVASGFDETGFIAIQRVMMQAGAKLRIISREVGLTNAWNGSGWGMSYPADSTLSTALAIDYDGLIVPDGKRHIDTLQNEAHAKRVLRAFLREDISSRKKARNTRLAWASFCSVSIWRLPSGTISPS